jgi:CubicO group peptidase (beta-lactamase class C family)
MRDSIRGWDRHAGYPGRSPWLVLAGVVIGAVAMAAPACGRPSTPPAPTDQSPAATPPSAPRLEGTRLERLQPSFADVDKLFSALAERSHAPGMAWGVLLDGELVHHGAAGIREVTSKAPIDADTVFRIASMTKSFTALSILALRDDGKLALDDPAEKYVPELRGLEYPTADSPKITVRHLLSHSAGFPEDNPWGDRQLARTDEEMSEMLRRGFPFSTEPGTNYEYSNLGFAILGRIVSSVSGRSYADYVAERILRPLGLSATTLEAANVPAGRRAYGYRWQDEKWIEEPPLPDGAFGAMGGMLTSTNDLGRYVGFLMDAWPPRDEAETGPVRRASVREMQQVWRMRSTTVQRGADGRLDLSAGGYGYGLGIRQTCEFGRVVSHTGGLPGFGSVMTWLPDYGLGVIAMVNLTYTSGSSAANEALSLLVKAAGLSPRQPTPSPALVDAREAVNQLIAEWDDGLADSIAADNLFLDESKDRRRRAFDQLRDKHGACRPNADFDVENALRGQWTLTCDRGATLASITLAPTMPPKVQHLEVRTLEPGAPTRQPVCRP